MSVKETTLVVIGFCDNMTDSKGVSRNVAYYIDIDGELQLTILAEANLDQITKEILIHAKESCTTLEDIEVMFNAPHSSLHVSLVESKKV